MKNSENELKNYIAGTERYASFDDYNSAEGELSGFDDYDSAEGQAQEGQAQPYVISYQNTTTNDVTAIFMGFNDYAFSTNYGNPTAVVLTNVQGGTYGRLINQSNNKNFVVSKWRFSASGSNITSQLQQTLQLSHVDGNGVSTTVPINLSVEKDLFQQQTDAIDVTKRITFDGNACYTFTLKASCTLTIAAYPTIVLSGKAILNGGANVNKTVAPRLSGKNIAPVIIQTSQDVRGITKG